MTTTTTAGDARDHLVRAAQSLYARQGVEATSPRDVLTASGLGHGSLYHHFASKRDLALVAVGRTVDETRDGARALLEGPGDSDARLRAWLTKPRDAIAGCRVGRLTADPFVMADPELHAEIARYFHGLVDELEAVAREGGLDEAAARDRAFAAAAIVQGGYVLAQATGDPSAMERAVRGFLAAIAR